MSSSNTKKPSLSSDYYAVDEILDTRFLPDGTCEKLVKWTGYSSAYNSWVKASTLAFDAEIPKLKQKKRLIRRKKLEKHKKI